MRPDKRLAHRVVAGKVFVMDGRNGTLHSLSDTATVIWKSLCAGDAEEEIAEKLTEAFDVSLEDAAKDVKAFLEELEEMELVTDGKNGDG